MSLYQLVVVGCLLFISFVCDAKCASAFVVRNINNNILSSSPLIPSPATTIAARKIRNRENSHKHTAIFGVLLSQTLNEEKTSFDGNNFDGKLLRSLLDEAVSLYSSIVIATSSLPNDVGCGSIQEEIYELRQREISSLIEEISAAIVMRPSNKKQCHQRWVDVTSPLRDRNTSTPNTSKLAEAGAKDDSTEKKSRKEFDRFIADALGNGNDNYDNDELIRLAEKVVVSTATDGTSAKICTTAVITPSDPGTTLSVDRQDMNNNASKASNSNLLKEKRKKLDDFVMNLSLNDDSNKYDERTLVGLANELYIAQKKEEYNDENIDMDYDHIDRDQNLGSSGGEKSLQLQSGCNINDNIMDLKLRLDQLSVLVPQSQPSIKPVTNVPKNIVSSTTEILESTSRLVISAKSSEPGLEREDTDDENEAFAFQDETKVKMILSAHEERIGEEGRTDHRATWFGATIALLFVTLLAGNDHVSLFSLVDLHAETVVSNFPTPALFEET